MKTLFFGSSEFAVPSLRVVAQRTQLAAVVTQPDRPAGRGHKLRPTPVKAAALELGIRVHEPRSLRTFAAERAPDGCDLLVLASFGRILPAEVLALPRLGALNVHPSLLPKYRGATPIQTALREGESETGVTVMLMDEGMDTGDIVLQERTPIEAGESYGELHDRLAHLGAQALAHAIDLAHSGHIPHRAQSGTPSVTHPLRKEDLVIDWSWPAQRIVNAVRAYAPEPAARAHLGGVALKLRRANIAKTSSPAHAEPGTLIGIDGDAALVQCGAGCVELIEVVPPSRGPMTGAAFALPLLAQSWK